MNDTPTLFDHDPAAIYEQYDKTFGVPANAPHDGHTCRECGNRQRWELNEHSNKIGQYCAVRKSKRTFNGLLKIKCNQAACCLFKNTTNNEKDRTN